MGKPSGQRQRRLRIILGLRHAHGLLGLFEKAVWIREDKCSVYRLVEVLASRNNSEPFGLLKLRPAFNPCLRRNDHWKNTKVPLVRRSTRTAHCLPSVV